MNHPIARLFVVALGLTGLARAQESAAPVEAAQPLFTVDGYDFSSWEEYLASNVYRVNGFCGTPGRAEMLALHPELRQPATDCQYFETDINPIYEPDAGIVYEIPVVWHVISNSNGRGNIPRSRIDSNMDVLNEDFRALLGSPGEDGTDIRIHFYLATEDPMGNPTNGINRVSNNTWFGDNGNYYDSLAWDTNRYLNIYTMEPCCGIIGYVPDLPQGGIAGQNWDRVVMLYTAVGRPSVSGAPFDTGRVLVHEVGHYLGLWHTFQDGCAGGDCYQTGDTICDTNEEANPTAFNCPVSKSSCGTPDPFLNHMDYSSDSCKAEFTPEQANRMRCSLVNYRPNLARSICSSAATSVLRNAGSNPAVFTATLPIVAETQTLSVSTAPYSFATILAYAGTDTVTLAGGQTLLLDLGSQPYFRYGTLSGPNASVEYMVRHDVDLCGLSFSMQAALFGGPAGFELTNAIDQVVGTTP